MPEECPHSYAERRSKVLFTAICPICQAKALRETYAMLSNTSLTPEDRILEALKLLNIGASEHA